MINLVFHDISNSSDQFDIDPNHFHLLINAIKENFSELDFRIYFDDGKISANEHAIHLKNETDFTVVCAVVSGLLDREGYLTSHQVQGLSNQGVTISAHGNSHAALAVSKSISDRETPAGGKYEDAPMGFDQRLTEKQVIFQLIESKKHLEKMGIFTKEFVFPYGLYNVDTIRINKEHRIYNTLSTCDPHADTGGTLRPRLLIDKSYTVSKLLSNINSLRPIAK